MPKQKNTEQNVQFIPDITSANVNVSRGYMSPDNKASLKLQFCISAISLYSSYYIIINYKKKIRRMGPPPAAIRNLF